MIKKLLNLYIEQIRLIRKGGIPSLLLKLSKIPFIIMAVPAVILVRLIRPVINIRFGPLLCSRIGHFACETEMYISEREKGIHGNGMIWDVFYFPCKPCNQQFKKMWKRKIKLFYFARFLDRINRLIPGGEKNTIPWRLNQFEDVYGALEYGRPHISFTIEEERKGKDALKKIGIPEGAPFVCFQARDSAYLDRAFPGEDWRYHSYRDASIQNYISGIEELTRRGYFALRMGSVVRAPIKTSNPKIIDYSLTGRTDFLDIFLSAKCNFFISSGSGLDSVAMVFRRPIAFTNFIPMKNAYYCQAKNIFIPKKLWLRSEKRFLTFKEMIYSDAGGFMDSSLYEKYGIDVIENTPEEIGALVIEMDQRLRGTWHDSKEDEELQELFSALLKPSHANQIRSRIGAEFLRKNKGLLFMGQTIER